MCLQHLVLLMRQSALRAVLFRRSSWTCGTSLIELDTALVFRWPLWWTPGHCRQLEYDYTQFISIAGASLIEQYTALVCGDLALKHIEHS